MRFATRWGAYWRNLSIAIEPFVCGRGDAAVCQITLTTLLVMAAVWNRAGHYIFALWFLSSSFFLA